MRHLKSVEVLDEKRSRWTAAAPAGTSVTWEAEIVNEKPHELIAWQSTEGASVKNWGVVRFAAAPAGKGTEVKVELEYRSASGTVGAALAKLFGEEPAQQVEEDLRRFKQVMETGEIPTTAGSRGDRVVGQAGKPAVLVERARSECARSTRAVTGSPALPDSFIERRRILERDKREREEKKRGRFRRRKGSRREDED